MVAFAPPTFSFPNKQDVFPVGRQRWVRCGIIQKYLFCCPLRDIDLDHAVATAPEMIAAGQSQYAIAVWEPIGKRIAFGVVGLLFGNSALCVHHIDLIRAGSIAYKRDAFAIGRESRFGVDGRVVGQSTHVATEG